MNQKIDTGQTPNTIYHNISTVMKVFIAETIVALSVIADTKAFSTKALSSTPLPITEESSTSRLFQAQQQDDEPKKKGFFGDLKGMFENFDDVVDDFVYKRMGAGEQWYGKRKYNPSGDYDGDYNGMGRSDQFRIELARVQKEEMEKRRLRRLAEEEEAKIQK